MYLAPHPLPVGTFVPITSMSAFPSGSMLHAPKIPHIYQTGMTVMAAAPHTKPLGMPLY